MTNTPLLIALMSTLTSLALALRCPERCSCMYDTIGRKTVTCDAGRLGASIPVSDMEKDTKVLIISSADEQPGTLTVGRIFGSLSQLEEVHITRANLPTIGENSFWGLKHLRVLNLTENNISSVLESHLRGIRGLQHLHLDNNKITTVPSATFMYLENLLTLTMAKNRLRGLTPRMFYRLTNLRTLDLSQNSIKELDPEVVKDLPSLTTLRCADCELGRIRSLVYKVIPYLETLDLRDNYLTELAAEEFMDLLYLKFLYLDGNRIFELRDYVFRNKGLHYLGFSDNHLEKIHRFAFEDCSIMEIDLSSNKFSHHAMWHLNLIIGHIQKLNIGGNRINVEHIRELLKRAPRLKRLNLSQMHINQIPNDMFTAQSRLETLNLSMNFLRFIPVDILHSLPSLYELDLRNNEFRGLPEIILRRLDRIDKLHLESNPWSCDQCHIPQLKVWLNTSKVFRSACRPDIDAPKCLKCQAPIEMFDKPIIEVDGLELQPCPEGTFDVAAASAGASEFSLLLAVVTAAVVLVLLAIILVVGVIMYNRHSAFYYTHESSEQRSHFYDNPALHSNHTDITMDEDLDHLPGHEENINQSPRDDNAVVHCSSEEPIYSNVSHSRSADPNPSSSHHHQHYHPSSNGSSKTADRRKISKNALPKKPNS